MSKAPGSVFIGGALPPIEQGDAAIDRQEAGSAPVRGSSVNDGASLTRRKRSRLQVPPREARVNECRSVAGPSVWSALRLGGHHGAGRNAGRPTPPLRSPVSTCAVVLEQSSGVVLRHRLCRCAAMLSPEPGSTVGTPSVGYCPAPPRSSPFRKRRGPPPGPPGPTAGCVPGVQYRQRPSRLQAVTYSSPPPGTRPAPKCRWPSAVTPAAGAVPRRSSASRGWLLPRWPSTGSPSRISSRSAICRGRRAKASGRPGWRRDHRRAPRSASAARWTGPGCPPRRFAGRPRPLGRG